MVETKRDYSFLKQNPNDLFIVADFDKTLTKAVVNGKPASTGPAVFRNGGYIHTDYVAESKALHALYGPFENDLSITREQRLEKMAQWWKQHLALFVKFGLTRELIRAAATDGQIVLKDEAREFFSWARKHNVPFLIFSSGFAQVIEDNLRQHNLLTPNVHVHANRFTFDKNGGVNGFESDVITSVNKAQRSPLSSVFQKEVVGRKSLLLLGDTFDDVGMAAHFDVENLFKVAFINDVTRKDKVEFEKVYDLLVEGDSLKPVLDLFK